MHICVHPHKNVSGIPDKFFTKTTSSAACEPADKRE